ncbi:3-hydroxyacyl-CoA dehydrogenase NAD-binding domain-containing protein [Planctomicrobium piriforme]|uniref:enoyl-CoA hydratase n=1 Tax=Planctomicrobium piriforme TaxID=1576369 RepID=A0A1I3L0N1_9PLAN|nr:3-hydroxyacyl-CoA dehydrogenase NAD-binding domain-containing protein [Planctomicrobium piriforme]SFI78281.1 3-hydroxyacyl-CoA dehydrogenase / enoyl-CoA hydratase / 3-hydroxybutyryl-CoA epimerase [Planctomicrobium piriforme]
MLGLKNFKLQVDSHEVLTATLDVPDRPLNVFDDSVLHDLDEIVRYVRLGEGRNVRMVVFRSGKPAGFLAGADIHRLQAIENERECDWILEQGQKLFSSIEELSVPTLAVVHGACVGGGMEFVLACKYRLAVNDPATRMGLPEVKLGLIPAWGGTQRLPKRVGVSTALPMMLEGKTLTAKEALNVGLVDGLISSSQAEEEIEAFVQQRLHGGGSQTPSRGWISWLIDSNPLGRSLAINQARKATAKLSRQYPALKKIIDAVEIGLKSSDVSEAGLAAERKAFTELLLGDVSPNLIDLFLLQEKAKKTSTWTELAEPLPVKRIAVIGAGTMGAGIAQLAAAKGYSVLLQDVKEEFVNKGMETIRSLFAKATSKGAISKADAEQAISRLQTRVDWGASDDVDLMIEAIVERLEIKQAVFAKADELLPNRAVLASNTSALPIDDMAKATQRPEKVGGLHFFNPVHKMPLVEVVRGAATSDETIATLVGVAKRLGKVPVVVKQSPGFLVNRILFPYLDESARLVTEGFAITDIDREAKKFGMPMGPLELLDVVGIDVALDVSKTLSPLAQQSTPSPALFQNMVAAGNKGQKTGSGFYNWHNGKRGPAIIPNDPSILTERVVLPDWNIGGETFGTIQQRLILAMLNEAQKCLVEQVVTEPWMVDLGMVLGTGFAPFRGGPMKCIDRWGAIHVKDRLQLLSQNCGPRFTPSSGFEPHLLAHETAMESTT